MARKTDGQGTIYKRGEIWWVKIHIDGKPFFQSSKSTKLTDATKLRNKLIAQKERGEITGGAPDRILIGELLDDVLRSDIAESTKAIWKLVIEKRLRPTFGSVRAARLTSTLLEQYREQRTTRDGVQHSTVNRELSILRTSLHNGRKHTPSKVVSVPYFPMREETNVREGFLSDESYAVLRDALPHHLKTLFVVAFATGVRRGELLAIKWSHVDFNEGLIALTHTKNGEKRSIPILDGDMRNYLLAAKAERDSDYPDCEWVFSRGGKKVTDFRTGWDAACKKAGVPDLTFHDLRRTAVRNMRRAGVPQVVRMKISGHKTDSMERRYNIVDKDDLDIARRFMQEAAKQREQAK